MGYKFNPFTGTLDTTDSPNGVFEAVEVNGDITLDDGGTFTTTLQTITPTANRTVSLPNATGTVALVAGSSGQITYNNAGANAGVSTFTADSSGRLTNSASSAASLPVKLWNGTIFAGTTPHVLVQPSTASAGSWSASGTALGVNTAAAFGGNLLDLQLNGSTRFSVTSGGVATLVRITSTNAGGASAPAIGYFDGTANNGLYFGLGTELYFSTSNTYRGRFGVSLFTVPGSTQLGFESGSPASAPDVAFTRSAAGVVKVTNGSSGDGTISGQLRSVGTAPASATATGTAGDIRYDASFIYVCTATNTWKRAAISTW